MAAVWQPLPPSSFSGSCLQAPIYDNLSYVTNDTYCAYKVPSIWIAQMCCNYYVGQIQDECTFVCLNADPLGLELCLATALNYPCNVEPPQIKCYNNEGHRQFESDLGQLPSRRTSDCPMGMNESSDTNTSMNPASACAAHSLHRPHTSEVRSYTRPSNTAAPYSGRRLPDPDIINLLSTSGSCTSFGRMSAAIVVCMLIGLLLNA